MMHQRMGGFFFAEYTYHHLLQNLDMQYSQTFMVNMVKKRGGTEEGMQMNFWFCEVSDPRKGHHNGQVHISVVKKPLNTVCKHQYIHYQIACVWGHVCDQLMRTDK